MRRRATAGVSPSASWRGRRRRAARSGSSSGSSASRRAVGRRARGQSAPALERRAARATTTSSRATSSTTRSSSANDVLEDDVSVLERGRRRRRCAAVYAEGAARPARALVLRTIDPATEAADAVRSPAMLIRLGHSPDPDDAFMFWALADGRVDTRGFEFEHVLRDIQTLNEWALEGRLETTAMSLASYPLVRTGTRCSRTARRWASGYGPIVVAREPALARRVARTRDRGTGRDDHGVPASAARARPSSRYRGFRSTRSSTRSKPGARRPACSSTRASSRTRSARARQVARPRRVVARSRPACRCPLGVNVARRDLGDERLHELSRACSRASIRVGLEQPRRGDRATRCASAETWTSSWPTGSSGCTSTS